MVFNRPFLPVLGNHDYYDLPIAYGVLSQLLRPLRQAFRYQIDLDVGWHGSYQGDAYARAFLDYLKDIPESELQQHLKRHYTVQTSTGKGLNYQPGTFTRLPNRYYRFRYGGIDFFALDSNTFNAPLPLESSARGDRHRPRSSRTTSKRANRSPSLSRSISPATVGILHERVRRPVLVLWEVRESIRSISTYSRSNSYDQI
jgi:hypothetical protein